MKPISKAQRDRTRAKYVEAGYPQFHVSYAGKKFQCFALPASLAPDTLKYGIMRYTPAPEELAAGAKEEEEAFFAIVDGVPEPFRRFVVVHEIIEFLQIGLHVPGRCAKAAEGEIVLLSQDTTLSPADQLAYVQMRHEFFGHLVDYAIAHPTDYSKEDVEEFQASHGFFALQVARLSTQT